MTIAIITGGSRGRSLGRSAALNCAARGIGVVLTYNSHPEGADVVDTASFAAFREAVAAVLKTTWDRDNFDHLVNNADDGIFNPITSVTEAESDRLFAVLLKRPFFLTQALLPLMADGGSIVNLTSATTRVATAGVAPYATFKGGLEVLTRYMAKEFGDRRIRANAVSPGAIRTNLGGGLNDEFESLLAAQTALGRVGEPDDIGRVVASLLSDDSAWINAQTIEVAGGYVI
jgi:NAD(P)-dependent dehydrogenase (short-subunit alcohol dehydrogenase family)